MSDSSSALASTPASASGSSSASPSAPGSPLMQPPTNMYSGLYKFASFRAADHSSAESNAAWFVNASEDEIREREFRRVSSREDSQTHSEDLSPKRRRKAETQPPQGRRIHRAREFPRRARGSIDSNKLTSSTQGLDFYHSSRPRRKGVCARICRRCSGVSFGGGGNHGASDHRVECRFHLGRRCACLNKENRIPTYYSERPQWPKRPKRPTHTNGTTRERAGANWAQNGLMLWLKRVWPAASRPGVGVVLSNGYGPSLRPRRSITCVAT